MARCVLITGMSATGKSSNDFGKTPQERAAILRDLDEVESLLRASADVEIDTRLPPDQVVSLIEDVGRR